MQKTLFLMNYEWDFLTLFIINFVLNKANKANKQQQHTRKIEETTTTTTEFNKYFSELSYFELWIRDICSSIIIGGIFFFARVYITSMPIFCLTNFASFKT